ncbi:MAG: AI-2E family transporter [Bryobacteraceae bacterium]
MAEFDTRLVRNVTGWLALAALTFGVIQIFRPFLVPLGWAAVLSVFFHPLLRSIRRYIRRPNLAALTAVVLITLLLVVPVVALTPALIGQSIALVRSLSNGDYLAQGRAFLERYWAHSPVPLGDIQEVVDELVRRTGALVAQQSARLAGNLVRSVFDIAVMLFAMFYLLRDGERIVELLRDILPWGSRRHDLMIQQAAELVEVTISSSFVTAAVQGALGGIVFWAVGISSPLFWGAFMGLMAFLPVVGPWLVWGPAAVKLLMTGQTTRGIVLIVLGFVIVSGVDNVLRPVLIAGRSKLNGLLVLVSVIGGVSAMGFLGVVLGPVLVATAIGLLKGYHESIASERQPAQPSTGESDD